MKIAVHLDSHRIYDLATICRALETLADRHESGLYYLKLHDACLQYVQDIVNRESTGQKSNMLKDGHSVRQESQPREGERRSSLEMEVYYRVLRFQSQAFARGNIGMGF